MTKVPADGDTWTFSIAGTTLRSAFKYIWVAVYDDDPSASETDRLRFASSLSPDQARSVAAALVASADELEA